MNKIDRIGMICAFVGFASLVYILANGSSLNMIHWPIEAYLAWHSVLHGALVYRF